VKKAYNRDKENAMNAPSFKLRIKIGNAEFDAEGPQETVQKSFDKFLKAAEKIPASPSRSPRLEEAAPIPSASVSPSASPSPEPPFGDEIDSGILSRVFDVDAKRGIVSLRILPPDGPSRACDAGIMILYGAQTMLRVHDLPVTKFKKGLLKSGVLFGRITNMIAPYSHMVIKGGSGVGGRYALNNQGVVHAENLIRRIFG
jgi:hypothetical protein